jgi:hypothetical protein
MYIRTGLSRKDLISLLTSNVAPDDVREITGDPIQPKRLSHGITALWAIDPRVDWQPPNVLSVSDEDSRDLLAWMWSYIPDFRPITAFMRVLSPLTLKMALEIPEHPSLKDFEGAWIGLILAEAARDSELGASQERLTQHACIGTASFVQARATALGYTADAFTSLGMAWARVKATTGRTAIPINDRTLQGPWSLLRSELATALAGDNQQLIPPPIAVAFRDMLNVKAIGPEAWGMLIRNRGMLNDARMSGETTREARVRLFDLFVNELLHSSARDECDAFLVAYLANQVNPGSMEHFRLLKAAAPVLPNAYFWYGILAGITASSKLHNAFDGIGRRVSRELMRRESVFERPTADIDFEEFAVMNDSSRADAMLRTNASGFLTVGLLPGVSTVVQLRRGNEDQTSGIVSDKGSDEIANQLRRLERALAESQSAYERINSRLGARAQRSLPLTKPQKRKDDE